MSQNQQLGPVVGQGRYLILDALRGFSLILVRHGRRLFVRRMLLLAVIGFLHMMLIWSGDILLLYAIGGLLLTLFVRFSDKFLFYFAMALIAIPVVLDALTEFYGVEFATLFYRAWWTQAEAQGINEDNFATWLRDADSYGQVFAFLIQGAYERIWEFVEGHRLPKVLGLFILGYLAGKHQLYARISTLPLKKMLWWFALIGIPFSLFYAWSAVNAHPLGLTAHSLLYAISVIPLAFCYVTLLCLLYDRLPLSRCFRWLAAPGRMALTNYISQSLIGMMLFYGIGFGLGTSFGLVHVELTALLIFVLQIVFCSFWFKYFRFGPLEWVWRILTYQRFFSIFKCLLPLLCMVVSGCSSRNSLPDENSVYYWRTEWRLDSTETAFLERYHIKKVFCRYFDVVMVDSVPMPNATIAFAEKVPQTLQIVPTVYITEDCMHLHHEGLAQRIVERIVQMNETNDVAGVREIQIDCDFTARSKKIYYDFLSEVRQVAKTHQMRLSTTIRLHQLSMEEPPADYGVLMLYNTGDPRKFQERNPILDLRDVQPYLRYLSDYPLPMAAAYPVFRWQRTIYGVRIEHVVEADEILRVKEAVEQRCPDLHHTIITYHLDKENINRYKTEDYEAIYHH